MSRTTTYRSMHDLGLAAWFGGSLFGIAGLNAAAEEAGSQRETARISSVGWAKWTPWNTVALGVHVVGGLGILSENRHRAALQQGAGSTATVKLVATGVALAASAYSRLLGKKIEDAVIHNASDASSSSTSWADRSTTQQGASSGVGEAVKEADKLAGQATAKVAEALPLDAVRAQRHLHYAQLVIPVATGLAIVLGAQAGEQQRPTEQLRGFVSRAGSAISDAVT